MGLSVTDRLGWWVEQESKLHKPNPFFNWITDFILHKTQNSNKKLLGWVEVEQGAQGRNCNPRT